MKKTNFVLILSLLINGCGQNDLKSNVETKSRNKINLSEAQAVDKKTPEETLRERLSEEEKKSLDFLKEALENDSKFNQFVLLSKEKVKSALEHIKTQVNQCNGNEERRKTFKATVQGYFNTMDESTLDGFQQGAISTCQESIVGLGG